MKFNFKYYVLLFFLMGTPQFGVAQQKNNEETNNQVWVDISAGYMNPVAFGNNFLNKGYNLSGGALIEARVYMKSIYFGLQGSYFKGDVSNISLVGNYERSVITHHFLHTGYSFFPKTSNLRIDTGLGLGYAYFQNYKSYARFHDDGFSIMAKTSVNYRLNKIVGIYMGVQFVKDFMAIQASPLDKRFFRNANMVALSAGLQFYINRK